MMIIDSGYILGYFLLM